MINLVAEGGRVEDGGAAQHHLHLQVGVDLEDGVRLLISETTDHKHHDTAHSALVQRAQARKELTA